MTCKFTVFFESTGGTTPVGWTESFYTNDSPNAGGLIVCLQTAKDYVGVRKDLLGANCLVQSVRTTPAKTDTTAVANRISQSYFFQGTQGTPAGNIPALGSFAPSQNDLFALIRSIAGYKRPMFLSGFPTKIIDTAIQQGVVPFFTALPQFTQWAGFIIAKGLQIRHKAPSPSTSLTYDQAIQVVPEDLRKRNRGRPFRLFRGRRLA